MRTLFELLSQEGAEAGGRSGEAPAGFGDPYGEYRAATLGCGVVCRRDRRLLRVYGRAPRRMLNGIVTNAVPDPPTPVAAGRDMGAGDEGEAEAEEEQGAAILEGDASYGTILTRKGRMVTDLVALWLGADEDAGIGLEVAAAAGAAVRERLVRYLPPRFARFEDLGDRVALLSVVGNRAQDAVAKTCGRAPASGLAVLCGGPLAGGAVVARGLEQVPSWNLWVPADSAAGWWRRLREEEGGAPVGTEVWRTLQIEAGYPAFGADMDDTTIPIEAGLGDRAFDHGKGCYTGQEVIVRLRDRGRVNWHLRRLRFGEALPLAGQELFQPGVERPRGRVTSSARSPRLDEVVGLGYVRREVEPPAELRLGSGEGPPVSVEER
ncbi:MAG: hypothetical protein OXG58_06950 [Gemmatimonadetes bacterium]|nr:hypothetical protein [Gemmatimonadota bacterium]